MVSRDTNIPSTFDVAVLMERRTGVTRWQPWVWQPIGLLAGAVASGEQGKAETLSSPEASRRVLWRGYRLSLHVDEAESYYHNLMADRPRAYVVTNAQESTVENGPVPAIVTLSFDEANAYAECEEDVEPVAMPAELVQWVEAFVVDNYVPLKRVKRKRRSWVEKR